MPRGKPGRAGEVLCSRGGGREAYISGELEWGQHQWLSLVISGREEGGLGGGVTRGGSNGDVYDLADNDQTSC